MNYRRVILQRRGLRNQKGQNQLILELVVTITDTRVYKPFAGDATALTGSLVEMP